MLIPLAKRILLKPIKSEKKSILLLKEEKPIQFQVIAIGDDVTKVKPTDVVYLEKYSGAEISHEEETFLITEESSILAKIA